MPAGKTIDEQLLRAALSQVCTVEVLEDRALLALQGPEAESVLARFAPDSAAMRFMDARSLMIAGSCLRRNPVRLHRRGWL